MTYIACIIVGLFVGLVGCAMLPNIVIVREVQNGILFVEYKKALYRLVLTQEVKP